MEEDETLLLKRDQSELARYPLAEAVACAMEMVLVERERGAENVSGDS